MCVSAVLHGCMRKNKLRSLHIGIVTCDKTGLEILLGYGVQSVYCSEDNKILCYGLAPTSLRPELLLEDSARWSAGCLVFVKQCYTITRPTW